MAKQMLLIHQDQWTWIVVLRCEGSDHLLTTYNIRCMNALAADLCKGQTAEEQLKYSMCINWPGYLSSLLNTLSCFLARLSCPAPSNFTPRPVSIGVALHRFNVFNCLFAFLEVISKLCYPSLISRVIADVYVLHWKVYMQTYLSASSNVYNYGPRRPCDAN